jgi:hypothetical protein
MAFSYPARLIKQGVCGTRPYKPYKSRLVAELKQSSTTTPCLIALLGMAKGLKTRYAPTLRGNIHAASRASIISLNVGIRMVCF